MSVNSQMPVGVDEHSKLYEPPRLIEHGPLEELTQVGFSIPP